MDRIVNLSDAELVTLRATWDEQDEVMRTLAWQQVKSFVKATALQDLLADARSTLTQWANNASWVDAQARGRLLPSGRFTDSSQIRRAAMPPLLDAIAATVAADGLSPEHETLLLEPLTNLAPHGATK